MVDDRADTVLERKAHAQRKALGVGAVSVPRALARALSIAADALWGLGLTCDLANHDTGTAERTFRQLSDDQLLILLENEAGARGLVALDRSVLTGIIEIQTLGKLTRFPLDDRDFTPTDAAMVAPLLDAALPRFASMLSLQAEMAHLHGFEFGALVDDIQTAGLTLEADAFQYLVYDIGLEDATRSGRVVFCFPEPEKTEQAQKDDPEAGKYESVLQLVPARMQAVLTRIHIPLAKAQALRPGDVLHISPNAITAATLVVEGGHVAAHGKMGQMNGFRAIRIGGQEDQTCLAAPTPPLEGQDMIDQTLTPPDPEVFVPADEPTQSASTALEVPSDLMTPLAP
ncbi:FliM/FliN family flagellar motor switch protein [Marivita sp. S0852]|uniref:FliM/FliN family flagellar motor switch protein n=1 Tax=Marivita sp. S0852 TaxID=3373893 RepID=UPI0039828FB0